MKNILSDEERQVLYKKHKKERDGRTRDRIKAVLLRDEGWSYEMIAHALLLSKEGGRKHVEDYILSKKLVTKNGGSSSKLDKDETQILIEHLTEQTYLYAKEIVAYISKTFGKEYTVAGITSWLKDHGFSYKKPAVVPGKANRQKQEEWIEKYKALKKTLPDDEAICFKDGVHPTHKTKPAYGWMPKGKRKEIRTNTGRQRINLSGCIDIISRMVLIQEDVTLNAESTIQFIKKIEEAYPSASKVYT